MIPVSEQITREQIVTMIGVEIQKLDASASAITEATDFTTDLSLDSMAVNDMMFALEEELDVSIPLNQLADIYTVGQLADLIVAQRAKRQG